MPCLVLGIADPRHPKVTDLPWCHTSWAQFEATLVSEFCFGGLSLPPSPAGTGLRAPGQAQSLWLGAHFTSLPQSDHQRWGSPLCSPPSPAAAPGAPALLQLCSSGPQQPPRGPGRARLPLSKTSPYLKHCSPGAKFSVMREKDAGKTQLKEV